MSATTESMTIANRFRNYLPVVVDVETAGFNPKTDALLEIACIPILMDDNGRFYPGEAVNAHIEPFEGANLEARALQFTGINPHSPMRKAIAEDEKTAIRRIFKYLKTVRQSTQCTKCILVGHNAHFDLGFLNALIERTHSKNQSQFHQFSVLDTVTLSALAFGQTVLARACKLAGLEFDGNEAHSALYDTQKTAELFCYILNNYPLLTPNLASDEANDDEYKGDERQDSNDEGVLVPSDDPTDG
ncbi:ribonuclease T [Moraxella osloensis]|uniref:Ribonuclease T n=1 Tax=Faucicola osloensis TaxID=34062 RepID=A0AAD0AED8_FAUOS|nr:ribonuclease T [Moraxella osloensis]ATQ83653.1 ribonuclease T [Moraxella osloensis]ATW86146.1 ribonuclease T [Moraxella osloensis]